VDRAEASRKAAATDTGTPVFRTPGNLVLVDVVVRDKGSEFQQGIRG